MKKQKLVSFNGKEGGLLYKKNIYLDNTSKAIFLEGEVMDAVADGNCIIYTITLGIYGSRVMYLYKTNVIPVGTKFLVKYGSFFNKNRLKLRDLLFLPEYKVSFSTYRGIREILKKRTDATTLGTFLISNDRLEFKYKGETRKKTVIYFTRRPHFNKYKMPVLGSYYLTPIGAHQRSFRRKIIYNKLSFFKGYLGTKVRISALLHGVLHEIIRLKNYQGVAFHSVDKDMYFIQFIHNLYVNRMVYLAIKLMSKSRSRDRVAFSDFIPNIVSPLNRLNLGLSITDFVKLHTIKKNFNFFLSLKKKAKVNNINLFYLVCVIVFLRIIGKLFKTEFVKKEVENTLKAKDRVLEWEGFFLTLNNAKPYYTRNISFNRGYLIYLKRQKVKKRKLGFNFIIKRRVRGFRYRAYINKKK